MKSGARIALAVGLGYVLGRRKKLRTALTLGAAVAAGRASKNPGGLLKYGTDLLNSTPQLGNLGKLGAPLATAGKAAATAAAGSGIDALSGRLRGSADALRRKSGAAQPDDASDERSAPDEEQELADQPEARDDLDQDDSDERQPAVARRQRGR
ncbi:hypothetical protein MRQ36_10735 [Micromonospora sp. R77]|uniref:hypothetical protein n=1 Tax=Micromonospora sp. R77 TaxID=2925836 RepID=UPI001F625C73|nr:hypothetical protein [Micromonospora sp. R77]MCI4063025.1 hypothetical protein [Micromonospora sp. R77]